MEGIQPVSNVTSLDQTRLALELTTLRGTWLRQRSIHTTELALASNQFTISLSFHGQTNYLTHLRGTLADSTIASDLAMLTAMHQAMLHLLEARHQ